MKKMKLSCVHSGSPRAQKGFEALKRNHTFVDEQEADIIVALGGDGFMLQCFHRFQNLQVQIYGMNRGTIGFLLNEYDEKNLLERVKEAEEAVLYPLQLKAIDVDGCEYAQQAYNEVSLIRYSQQSANLQIRINGKERLGKIICDGVLVSTPAGSTAYNFSAHGPIIPIGSNILALTPISPFRPRRWRGALLPHDVEIDIAVLDPQKRPIGAAADSFEIQNVQRVIIKENRSNPARVLFDKGHSLEERIIREQFTG